MKVERTTNGSYRLEIAERDLHLLQFMARFMTNLFHTNVFSGRFRRGVERLNRELEDVQ